MMTMERTILKIEEYYNQYLTYSSNVLLNLNTDTFINRIESLPQCKQIIEELKSNYPITDDEFRALAISEIHKYKALFENHDPIFYVAFCIQWYNYQKEHETFLMKNYADKARWLTKTDKDNIDKVRIFKTDVIRPIVDYLITQIKEHHAIYYYLDKYKSRVERYTFSLLTEKNELGLQKDLALYLFDQNLPFCQEPNLGHGRPDFVIDLECNGKPFVIEVKKMDELEPAAIDEALRQLKAYLGQFPSYGCLYIFTQDSKRHLEYPKEIDENLTVRCVYLRNKTPSQL